MCHIFTISPGPFTSIITFLPLLEAREARKHMAWMLPCRALIGDQDVRGKKTERRLAHFHSLITFTGPQSHLRNHGDADKVTHDYSSMAPPDWTAPESLAKRIHQRSLCPCSTSIRPSGWWGRISAALGLFFTFTSCLNLTLHLASCPPNYLSSRDVPPISLGTCLPFSNPSACSPLNWWRH